MPSLSPRIVLVGLVATSGLLLAGLAAEEAPDERPAGRWKQHDVRRPKPTAIEPAGEPIASGPPKGAVVLFDGSSLDAWKSASGGPAKWEVVEGALQTVPGAGPIETKRTFGDVQLHVEWSAPDPPVGKGQDRGNSGIFLMGQFEVQVLDSFRAETYADGQAGAIYGQYPPLFNASRPPSEWQAYDIAFRRPRFDPGGKLLEPARLTVFHNGVLVQDNEEAFGPTSWLKALPYRDQGDRGPIALQDHDHPVRYRNIWLLELPERAGPPAPPLISMVTTLPTATLDRYVGEYEMNARSRATVLRRGDQLVISFSFRPQPIPIEPISETKFDLPSTDAEIDFKMDDRGTVTGAQFRVGDGDRFMKRVEP